MNKKIIAALLVATILFMCAFAGCNKLDLDSPFDKDDEGIYVKNKDINFVTDENGEKLLDSEGRIIVYATDEDGKKIKDNNGQYVTHAQEFQPIEDDGVVEDLGFFFEIPEGWKSTNKFGVFENKDANQVLEITIIKQFYDDYYMGTKEDYKELSKLSGVTTTWNEELDLGEDFKGLCRFTMETENGIIVMYFFENSKNLYKVRFVAEDNMDTALADSEAMLKLMSFKPYAYYTDITAKTTETTEAPLTTAVAD